MRIRIAYTGRGHELAEAIPPELDVDSHATVADVLTTLKEQLGNTEIPASCLIAVSGEHIGSLASHGDRPLRDGDEILLIAPVAGG